MSKSLPPSDETENECWQRFRSCQALDDSEIDELLAWGCKAYNAGPPPKKVWRALTRVERLAIRYLNSGRTNDLSSGMALVRRREQERKERTPRPKLSAQERQLIKAAIDAERRARLAAGEL